MSKTASDGKAYRLDLIEPHELESGGMTISKMAAYHNRLDEMGRKKTVKKELFADMIRDHSADDVYVYFRQFSDRFAHPDRALGIGDATMNAAAEQAFAIDDAKALRGEYGGSLTRALRDNEIGEGGVDVDAVALYEQQLHICEASADWEITQLVAEMFERVQHPWVWSQMVGSDFACYVGDYMYVDAIALVDDSITRTMIRRAWGIQNDGPLVVLDWARDDRDLQTECQPHTMIGEMKAKSADAETAVGLRASDEEWVAQTKYDGARLFLHHSGDGDYRAYMAGNSDVTAQLPELFAEPLSSQLPDFPFIIDGEVTPYDPDTGEVLPFQHILKRTGRDPDEMVTSGTGGVEARFKWFDVLNWQGHDVSTHPYHERLEILQSAFTPDLVARTGTDFTAVYQASLDAGHEGVVLKNMDASFEFRKRSSDWLKWKADPMDADLRISGAHEGAGRAAGGVGSLRLQASYHHGWVTVGSVGTGFSNHDRERLWKQHQAGELVGKTVQVSFEELQVSDDGSDIALRFPSFQSLRPDGEPDTVSRLSRIADVEDEVHF